MHDSRETTEFSLSSQEKSFSSNFPSHKFSKFSIFSALFKLARLYSVLDLVTFQFSAFSGFPVKSLARRQSPPFSTKLFSEFLAKSYTEFLSFHHSLQFLSSLNFWGSKFIQSSFSSIPLNRVFLKHPKFLLPTSPPISLRIRPN